MLICEGGIGFRLQRTALTMGRKSVCAGYLCTKMSRCRPRNHVDTQDRPPYTGKKAS
jgi:hypothetical protein